MTTPLSTESATTLDTCRKTVQSFSGQRTILPLPKKEKIGDRKMRVEWINFECSISFPSRFFVRRGPKYAKVLNKFEKLKYETNETFLLQQVGW